MKVALLETVVEEFAMLSRKANVVAATLVDSHIRVVQTVLSLLPPHPASAIHGGVGAGVEIGGQMIMAVALEIEREVEAEKIGTGTGTGEATDER